jgi:hydroxymethylbilane synthase
MNEPGAIAFTRTPIGAHAWLEGANLKLIVEALSPDGRLRFRREGATEAGQLADPKNAARDLGLLLGGQIKAEAGDAIVF